MYAACKQVQEEYALDDLIALVLGFSHGEEIPENMVHPEELHDAMLFFLPNLGHVCNLCYCKSMMQDTQEQA